MHDSLILLLVGMFVFITFVLGGILWLCCKVYFAMKEELEILAQDDDDDWPDHSVGNYNDNWSGEYYG